MAWAALATAIAPASSPIANAESSSMLESDSGRRSPL
jgi:hypothetical protein